MRRTAGSKTRFSASKRKNNFPHIMLLIAVRSLNYRMSIVYCELISPSFDSVHLSFLTHSSLLIYGGKSTMRLANYYQTYQLYRTVNELYFITDQN